MKRITIPITKGHIKTTRNFTCIWKLKFSKRAFVVAVMLLFVVSFMQGVTRTASVSGNWSNTATWGGAAVPTSSEDVVVNNGINVNVDVNAACKSLSIASGNKSSYLTISGTCKLDVSGSITINAGSGSGNNKYIAVGSGTLNAGSVTMADTGGDNRDSYISISTGTATISGNITMNGSSNRNQIVFFDAGFLNMAGTGTISGGTISSVAGGYTALSSGTVNYNGNAQAIGAYAYYNLTLSGSGTKTFVASTVINNNISINSGASANLGAGLIHTANALYLNGSLQPSSIYGGTGSPAIYINTAYFVPATGVLSTANNWTGATSTVWNTTSNWSKGTVPTASDDAFIPNVTNKPVIGTSAVCNNLAISPSSSVTINGSNTLSVARNLNSFGTFICNAGTLSIGGDFTNSGTFNSNTGTVVYNGAAQTMAAVSYYNLTLSGSNTKTLTAGSAITANALTVSSGVTLLLNGTSSLTPVSVTVDGVISVSNTALLTKGTGTISFNSGSIYEHARNGGAIPTATWQSGSLLKVTGITSTIVKLPSNIGGSVEWNCPAQTVSGDIYTSVAGGATFAIGENLTLTNTNSGSISLFNLNGQVLNIGGNYTQTNGSLTIEENGTNDNQSINISGDFKLSGGTFSESANVGNTINLNIAKNWNQTGGILDFNRSTSGTSNVSVRGNFSNTAGSNSITTSGSGAPNGNFIFNGTNQTLNMPTSDAAVWTTYTINAGSNVQLLSNITLNGSNSSGFYGQITVNGTLDAGTFTITDTGSTSGATQFNLNSGGTLITANTNGVNGTLPSSTTTKNLNASANYIFNGTSAQVTGTLLTNANNLTVTNPAGVTLSSNLTVSGNLSILTSGTTLNYDQYQITGNATGTMTMDPGTTLTIGRSGQWNTTDFPTNFTKAHISLDPTSTVIFYGGYRGVSSSPDYGNLMIACTSGQACVATGNLVINGDLAINAGSSLRLAWSGLNTMTIGGQLINNGRLEYGNISGNGQIVTVAGNLSGSGTITMTSANLSPHTLNLNGQNNSIGALTTDGNNSVVNYGYTGAGTQQVFASPNYQSMTISGSAKVLQGAATVNNTLTLTSGVLTTTTSNLLTITNTATTAIAGGSVSSYINGPVKWSVTSGSTYNFPIGSSSAYLPFSLVPTATTTAQIQAYSMSSGGSADGSTVVNISSTEYWSMTTGSSVSGSSISVSRPLAITPLNTLAAASSSNGSYSTMGGVPDTYSVSNATYTGSGTTAYFVIAQAKGSSIWLKADAGTGTTTDGSPVDTWVDQSEGSNDASAKNTAPLYKVQGWNFNPGINFPSGGNGYFLSAKNNITNDMTFVVVYNSTQNKTGSAWADPTLIGCETSSVNNDYYLSTDNGKPFFKGVNTDQTSPIATSAYNNNLPHIVSVTRQKSITGNIYLYVDGSASVSGASDNTILNAPQKIGIGNHYNAVTSAQFEGGISEVYGTNSVLPITNLQNFESYLALKYGITIAHDYTNGSGTTIYSVSDHKNNIAGLGSENTSTGGYGLNQQISASSNLPLGTASRIVMTTSGNFTDANSAKPQVLANGQYMIWGDDNGSISSWTTKGAYSTVTRTWKVQNTSVTVPLNFQIDLNSSSFPTSDSGMYTLLVSTDGSFSSSTTTEYLLTLQSGSLYATSGITFPNGTCYFSIGHPVYSTAVYVRVGGKGNQTGTSWSNAMSTIQKAIETSNKLTTKLPVYVAAGSYSNDANYTYTYNSASVSFLMRNGVSVLGGFVDDGTTSNPSGTTTSRLTGSASILNGSYSQVLAPESASFTNATVWDGFYIKNAPSGAYAATIPSNATIQNCKIRSNSGGGLNLLTGTSSSKNASAYNVLVADNGGVGVAMADYANLINATIANNAGVGINSGSASATVTNTVLWKNSDNVTGTLPNITYSAAGSNYASGYTSNIWNANTVTTHNFELYHRSPNFKDPANGDYSLLLISPCLGKGLASSNTTTVDANGNIRKNGTSIDIGAFQKWDGYTVSLVSSTTTITKYPNGPVTSTLSDLNNAEVLLNPGTTLNISGTITPSILTIYDDNTTSPIITCAASSSLTANKALYIRKFKKLRTDGSQAWTFFGVPYDVNVNNIDGAIIENTARIEPYTEKTRADYGANKSAWTTRLNTTNSTMHRGTGYALQLNNKIVEGDPYYGNIVIFPSGGPVTFPKGDVFSRTLEYDTNANTSWFDWGWNFISNPFPQIATIEYSTSNYWPLNSSGTTDPSVNAYGGGVYTYDTDIDTYDIIPLVSFYTRGLAPFAGCFIKNGANIGNIQFKQLASSPNPLKVKSFSDVEQVTSDIAKPMLFHLHASGNNKSGNTYVLFHPNAHAAQVEIEDSPNWSASSNGSNIVMNTFAEGSSLGLGINMLPFTGNSIEIPLQISVPDKGDYTITLPEKDSTLVVYIKDDSGSLTNLNLSSYTFSVADATSVPNFALVFRKKTGSLGENTDSRITFIQSQTNIAVYGLDVMKQLLVYTPTGQLCKQKELNGYETSIDLPSIPGVYLVKIVTNKGAVTKKVINP
ncbi:T9SS type A sorting domain-containing protein [Paludibacter jiangxiensis]|nr:T9SS type A sorting domain-containing protein [Paludibacter jiangxiensis]